MMRTKSTIRALAAQARAVRTMTKDVPSPCISVCRMDPASDLCLGCYRTLREVAEWSTADDDAKRRIWAAIAQRLPTER